MHADDHTDRITCPSCGPSVRTVADALATTSDERLAAAANRLAFRPMSHTPGRRALLVEVATNEPVLSWCAHEARALAQEVLAGPFDATLYMDTPRGTTVTFTQDELVALAVALAQVADKLDAPGRDTDALSQHRLHVPRAGSGRNRAARRASGRRTP